VSGQDAIRSLSAMSVSRFTAVSIGAGGGAFGGFFAS
jgi:hypothetical protein